MLGQVRNERRAAGSDGVGIARISSTLLDDIAARVFEVGRTKTAQLIERRIVDLAQGRLRCAVTRDKLA